MGQVKLAAVGKRYGEYVALSGIDLDVAAGELLVLVGPSGCGKSTLLRAIAGLETIDEGEIRIGERVVASGRSAVSARDRDVAMVFQNYALYPHMSVAENLGFGLRMRGVDRLTREGRVREMAKLLGIEALLDRKPGQLSGGQQQRVAVGRALVRDPEVFLLDEPLSNLDTELRNQTRSELKRLHQRLGTTMIYVTHDQVEAMTLADRLVVMEGGILQQVGAPHAVYRDPANGMVAQFLGYPPMNFFELTRDGNHWLWLGQPLATLSLATTPAEKLWLGIRPEAVHSPPRPDQPRGSLLVELIEPLGNETIVQGKVENAAASLRIGGEVPWRMGERIAIGLDLTDAVLFDPRTRARVRPAE